MMLDLKTKTKHMQNTIERVGVVGSDARTHAIICHLIKHSPSIRELWCAPGNPGIQAEKLSDGTQVKCVPISPEDIAKLTGFAAKFGTDMTIVSPEKPLALGIVNRFARTGLRIFGCNSTAAMFESSKCFAQRFAQKHGVWFAPGQCCSSADNAKQYARRLDGCCAVKADELRGGKGVKVCHSVSEANAAIDAEFALADSTQLVVQKLLEGTEVSLMLVCDGMTVKYFETAQDYKRALDGDHGLQTGGLGGHSGLPLLTAEQLMEVEENIVSPWLAGCKKDGIVFRGVLYIGLMITEKGIFALEFNVRLGDPEAEVLLPRLDTDFLEIADACLSGTLRDLTLQWRPLSAVCVVMAAPGYPEKPVTGKLITGLNDAGKLQRVKVYHAGTTFRDGEYYTNGGRVLAVTAWDEDIGNARMVAYDAVRKITFEGGQHFRRDIAEAVLPLCV